ncbi:pyocin knob domain-containing S74 family peptidase [Sinorhizobium meliloti]|uniref:Phage tail protein n=1 Tax=Rhizobium meliloti TaxID=382 RepID=A0A2J0Z0C5_RHIML|nr:pyocin knob domain-containing S74 family peptidase [Sinorhizobium meliloti]PJR13979.1 phage tail protein [Sinorhizobium meliloti]
MTIPYVTGTVSVTAGSAVVTGSGTAWATALIAGGLFGLDSSNGNPVPILSVDSNTQLTLAKPWRGTTAAGQGYWIVRDTAYLQQQTVNAQALSTYIQRLDNAALAALAGLTPATDKLGYFTGAAGAALTDIKAKGRDLLAADSMLSLLGKLGPVNGGVASPVPSAAGVGLSDGDFNTIIIAGTYTITGSWTNGPSGAAAIGYTAILNVYRRFGMVFQEIYIADATSPKTFLRFSAEASAGTWPNPWWNTTNPAYPGSEVVRDLSLPGRLRELGALVADANTATTSGFYTATSATTNLPEAAHGTLIVATTTSNAISQTYIRTSNNTVWMRSNGGGGFTSWIRVGLTDRQNTWAGTQSLDAGGGYVQFALNRGPVVGSLEAGTTFIGLGAVSDHALLFKANNVERARFEPTNGDFLVGLTATIDPATGSTTGVAMRPATGRMWRRASGYNPFYQSRLATDGAVQEFYRENSSVGGISVTATGTSFSTTSDYRLKSDVQPIVTFSLTPEQFDVLDNAELKIMALRPVFHRWNNAPEKGLVTGFIAHEAQQVLPHAVTGRKDEVVDVGREIFPAHDVEREIVDEDGNTQTVTVPVPEVVNEGVRRDALAEGAVFEKTGEVPVFQTMDYGLITADIVAALQCVIHKNMLQGEEIEALKAANADMASRLAAIEEHLALV